MTRTLTLAFAAIVSTSLTNSANAGYRHIDELAVKIQRQSVKLIHEFRSHYSRTPEFRHLIIDARQLHRLAQHVHELAHHRGSILHLQSDLRELDRSFHHLEEIVERIERNACHYRAGHIRGRTKHVRKIMNRMANNIHHLQEDVDEMAAVCPSRHNPYRVDRHEVRRPNLDYRSAYRTAGPTFGVRFGSSGIYWNGNQMRFGY